LQDRFVVGVRSGNNWQFNQFLLGVEGDGSFVDWGGVEVAGTAPLRGGGALTASCYTPPWRRGVRDNQQLFGRRRISALRRR
jgi:hypothetical protein